MARQFASLDHLSEGRAAWNVVTSWDAFTGENFRRGGFLAQEDRYERAREFLQTARELWDSWDEDAVVADQGAGTFLVDPGQGAFAHHGAQFDIDGRLRRAPLAAGPAGHLPGRRLRRRPRVRRRHRRTASSPGTGRIEAGQALLPGREGTHGPLRPFARRAQDPPRGHLRARGQRGGRHRTGRCHPWPAGERGDGHPLPGAGVEPRPLRLRPRRSAAGRGSGPVRADMVQGPGQHQRRPAADRPPVAGPGRGQGPVHPRADDRGHQPAIVHRHARAGGRPRSRPRWARRAADGFILIPHITPGGLDRFADTVVPILQERGSFRAEYEGPTLRDHLGLQPARTPERHLAGRSS